MALEDLAGEAGEGELRELGDGCPVKVGFGGGDVSAEGLVFVDGDGVERVGDGVAEL